MSGVSVILAIEVDEAALPAPATELDDLFTRALAACGFEGRVSLAVVDDETMRVVNRDYHETDAPTDVLAFPLGDPPTPDAFHAVQQALETAGVSVSESGIVREPQNTVSLDASSAESALKLLNMLEDHDDAQNVYANLEIEDA